MNSCLGKILSSLSINVKVSQLKYMQLLCFSFLIVWVRQLAVVKLILEHTTVEFSPSEFRNLKLYNYFPIFLKLVCSGQLKSQETSKEKKKPNTIPEKYKNKNKSDHFFSSEFIQQAFIENYHIKYWGYKDE